MKRKKDFRQQQKYTQRHKGGKGVSPRSKKASKAVPGGSGMRSNVFNRMLFRAMKERKERNTVLRLLHRPTLPPRSKTCFHKCLIPYWAGPIVLCSPGNAPQSKHHLAFHPLQRAGRLKLYFVLQLWPMTITLPGITVLRARSTDLSLAFKSTPSHLNKYPLC